MVGINKTKMKKIYVSLLFIGLVISSAVAQSNSAPHRLKTVNHVSDVTVKPVTNHYAKSVLWTEDFAGGLNSTNGTWTVGGTNGDIWKHSFFKSSGEWSSGTNPMASTTEANGYMLFDADSVNFPVSPNYINLTGELISPTIDLSGATSALLEFQQDFRFCCAGSHDITVSVSNDGGATWGPASNVTNGTPTNDDFYGSNGDSYVFQLNISSAAAGNSNVKLKFTWDGNASGTSHYYWTIDDINISTLPDHDLVALSSWVVGSTNDGIEYGKTPEDQADANWIVGTEVYNFGANVETNVTLDADFGGFTSQTIEASFGLDTTIFMQSTEALTLTPAVYNGTYTVTSDDETAASPLFGNNTRTREFEITAASTNPGSIYAQDGIDVYANPILSSLGTASFTGAADALVCATMYHIKATTEISGIRVMLANGSTPGGEVFGSIKDTSLFWQNNMTSLFSTNASIVSGADINAGFIDVYFSSPVTLTPGAYYAAVELFSNSNAGDIVVLDDQTVPQPFDASAIYIPNDQSYTNGTALGIRMLMGSSWLNIDQAELNGVSVYPNPSSGVINITNDAGSENTIEVFNTVGQVVTEKEVSSDTTINLSSHGTGVYFVKVSNETGSIMERVVIQ